MYQRIGRELTISGYLVQVSRSSAFEVQRCRIWEFVACAVFVRAWCTAWRSATMGIDAAESSVRLQQINNVLISPAEHSH